MKVALVYDRVNKWGGAERVLLALHKLFPNAPLFTSVCNGDKSQWAADFTIHTSFLQNFPFAKSSHEYYPLLMPLAFEQYNFDAYELVISVTSEAAKGIITRPQTKHLCYMLTPTRYLWSGHEDYFSNSLFKTVTKPAVSYLRSWDIMAAQRPDEIVSISKEVRFRVKKYYDRDSLVVYPPVTLGSKSMNNKLSNKKQNSTFKIPSSPFFLIVSRLVPYKRIDLAIETFNRLHLPLTIIGTGNQEAKLKKFAGPTITFLSSVDEKTLVKYYQSCEALIFPGNEDFGLTVLEAQAYGKPVIAYRKGGALETIIEGTTGEFFETQTIGSLKDAIYRFQKKTYKPDIIIKNAHRFNETIFNKQFLDIVSRVMV